jgi:membrane protease YdiL (CAAX protease family)
MSAPQRDVQRDAEALPHAEPLEALGIVALCFGWFILSSVASVSTWSAYAPALTGDFNDASFTAMVVFELMMGAVAIGVLWARRYPLHMLAPQPSWRGALVGVGLYLCTIVLDTIAWHLAPHTGATPFDDMMARAHVSWPCLLLLALVNGTYEEVFLLAYLMRGLRRYGGSTAVGVVLLVRMLYHMYQGPVGTLMVTLFGIVLGVYYQRTGRLFPAVLAHVIADVVPFLYYSA